MTNEKLVYLNNLRAEIEALRHALEHLHNSDEFAFTYHMQLSFDAGVPDLEGIPFDENIRISMCAILTTKLKELEQKFEEE